METLPAHLITSSNEQTWKFDRPVIFLNDWILRDNRRQIWEVMDIRIADHIYPNLAQRDEEYKREKAIENDLFPKFCAVLNVLHGTEHGERFWKIVLGHWFRRYVHLVFNRLRSLEVCLDSNEIASLSVFTSEEGALVTRDSNTFNWCIQDDNWNDILLGKLFAVLDLHDLSVEYIKKEISGADTPHSTFIVSRSQRGKEKIYQLVRNWARYLSRNSDALIVNSYLPLQQEFKLSLCLTQFPQWWISPRPKLDQRVDLKLRAEAAEKLATNSLDNIEKAINSLLFDLLPICYLEGFSSILKSVEELEWPKKPKFIFTSNNYDSDEIFKLWTATKVELGVKYFVGQHGNNFGTARYENPTVEEASSDVYITWGWSEGMPQHIPAFNFRTVGKSRMSSNPNGNLLLVELASAVSRSWEGSPFESYFNDQITFVKCLEQEARENLIVRLYQPKAFAAGNELARWNTFDGNIKIDVYTEFWKLASQSRLLLFSYDSTGILEALALNLPLIAFWQNGLDHLRDSAIPYYEQMIQAGIFHLNPDSAARKVNEVWDDVDKWWMTTEVQNAREAFCSQYSRTSKNPIRDLKKILLENI